MLNHHFIQESISDCKINILFYRKPPPASLMMEFLNNKSDNESFSKLTTFAHETKYD